MATTFPAPRYAASAACNRHIHRLHGWFFLALSPMIMLLLLALARHVHAAAASPSPRSVREIRALICAGEWEKALHAAPVATVRPGTTLAEGKVEFDVPILLPIQSPPGSRVVFTPYSWIEFEQTDGCLKAWLVLRFAGKGGAKWAARLEVFDGSAPATINQASKPLFTASTRFDFQGGSYLFGNVFATDTREGEARLDLGPLPSAARPLAFRIAFDQLESVMGAPVSLRLGEPTPLRAALAAAVGPALVAASDVRLNRSGDALQALVHVTTLSSPKAKWRLMVRVFWRNTKAILESSTEFENSGAVKGINLREERDLTLDLGSLADIPQGTPTAVLALEQIEGEVLQGMPAKATPTREIDGARAMYCHMHSLLHASRTKLSLFATGYIAEKTLKLQAIACGLNDPKARLTWRLMRQAPEGWSPPCDELEDDPGTITWCDPATGRTWILDAYHGEVVGGSEFYFMEPGVWRVMAMGRDGKRGVFGLSEPVSLDWSSSDTTAPITFADGSPLSLTLLNESDRKQIPSGWVVLRRADGLPVSAAGTDSNIQFYDALKLPALPPGRYTATAGSRYNFYQDEFNKQLNFARREGVPLTIEAGKENKAEISLPEAHLTADQVRRHWPWVIEGRVTDAAGNPLSGVTINSCANAPQSNRMPSHSGLVTTGPDGRYTMRLLRGVRGRASDRSLLEVTVQASLAQSYEKNLSRQGLLALAGRIPFDVPPGSDEARRIILPYKPYRLDFVMLPAAQVRGRVVNRQGDAVANELLYYSNKLMLEGDPRTGSDGRFTIDNAPCTENRFWVKGIPSPPIEFKTPGPHEIELIYDNTDEQHPQVTIRHRVVPQ